MSNRVRANQRKQQLSESGLVFPQAFLAEAAALADAGESPVDVPPPLFPRRRGPLFPNRSALHSEHLSLSSAHGYPPRKIRARAPGGAFSSFTESTSSSPFPTPTQAAPRATSAAPSSPSRRSATPSASSRASERRAKEKALSLFHSIPVSVTSITPLTHASPTHR